MTLTMPSVICRHQRVTALDECHRAHREDAIELCRRHGEDPDTVNWAEFDVIDIPLLRFGLFHLRDGRAHLKCYPDDDETHQPHEGDCSLIAIVSVERALIGRLPEWWQPA